MAPIDGPTIRIGDWYVNATLDQIRRDERVLKLEPRTMRLLIYLAEHAGEVISIGQLLDEVWKEVVVSPASVYQAISTLRRLLGDNPSKPTYIASVARRGYRLVAPVSNDAATSSASAGKREACPAVAVLPFVDISETGDQQYFADGLSIELINLLTKIPGLRVPARASSFYFRNNPEDMTSIGRRLMVTHLLEGSVRKWGNRLRISAQLVNVDSGYHIWSRIYDRELDDIFKIQDEIAAAVTTALKVSILGDAAPIAGHQTRSEPYTLYLQARAMNQRRTGSDNVVAIDYLRRALALDPHFSPAWAMLSDVLVDSFSYFTGTPFHDVRRDAHAAAERALELDGDLVDAHIALARFFYMIDWNFDAAEFEANQALSIDPNNSQALRLASEIASTRSQPDLACKLATKSILNDPLDSRGFTRLAGAEVGRRNFLEAESALLKALELNPTAAAVRYFLVSLRVASGRAGVALSEANAEPDDAFRHTSLALVFDALGRKADADRELLELQEKHAGRSAYQIVEVLTMRGEIDQAFEWLYRAYLQRDTGFIHLVSNPLLDNLKHDPRLLSILRKLNLGMSFP